MKRLRTAAAGASAFVSGLLLTISAAADGAVKEFADKDRLIFGIFPLWALLLLLAGVVMAAIIIIVEIVKRKMK